MAYTISWLVPDYVIVAMYYDELTMTELREGTVKVASFAERSTMHCTTLVELRHLKRWPFELRQIIGVTDGVYKDPAAHTIALTANPMIVFPVKTVLRFMDMKFHAYRETEPALALAQQLHPDIVIPDLPGYEAHIAQMKSTGAQQLS